MKLVSIVLPVYNGSRYLEQSIESCLEQTYSNWELIIVDDASTDNTPDIIAKYVALDRRIHSVRNEVNRRLPAALNTGFSLAKGEYLTWTSDDNLYRPTALAEMVAFLESHSEFDIVYCDYTEIDSEGTVKQRLSARTPDNLVFNACIGPCFLYRKVVQEKLEKYEEELFLCEDYDFWLRASVYFQAQPLHNDLYAYRRHESSLTHAQPERHAAVHEETIRRNFPKMGWLTNWQRASGYFHMSLMYCVYNPNNKRAIYRNLLKAIRYSPGYVLQQMSLGFLAALLLDSKSLGLLKFIRKKL